MSTRIYKYKLDRSIAMPIGAKILCIQAQAGQMCLWAQVNSDAPTVCRKFLVYPTGVILDDVEQVYIGTVQEPPYVWHIYEEIEHD